MDIRGSDERQSSACDGDSSLRVFESALVCRRLGEELVMKLSGDDASAADSGDRGSGVDDESPRAVERAELPSSEPKIDRELDITCGCLGN